MVASRKRVEIGFRRDLFPKPNSARLSGGPDVTLSRLQVPVKRRYVDAVGRDRS